ncbi:MAG TPA: 2-phospho-L-lactate transferase CofD family protein [Vicinamibacteria bacterium]|nr:2-phospho-L-lactate transferase CofD family protein [Vicinamibacteria bacterium]
MTGSHAPPPRVVAVGGGTGLPALLPGLKRAVFPPDWPPPRGRGCRTALVTVADDGGSSGLLCRAYRVLAPGETDGYSAAGHVLAIRRHLPGSLLHVVPCNVAPLGEGRIRRYSSERAAPVAPDLDAPPAPGGRIVKRDLVAEGDKVRHDPGERAAAILEAGADAGDRAVETLGAGRVRSRDDMPMRARRPGTS